jgi:ABC-type transport system involved in cytochrome c biogenesis permease subunit
MILGMTTATFTLVHVLLSLAGIGSGLVVLYGLLTAKRLDGWTAFFLATTVATSITGFFFPITKLTPGLIIGALSLVLLALAIAARYQLRLLGGWRTTYVISAMVALYFNVLVLIVQSFEKVPALSAAAPTQKEPPFLATQVIVMALFVWATFAATKRFREETVAPVKSRAA